MDMTDISNGALPVQQPSLSRPPTPARPASPVSEMPLHVSSPEAILILKDGTSFRGISFGDATKSASGECVCQTGTLRIYFRPSVFRTIRVVEKCAN